MKKQLSLLLAAAAAIIGFAACSTSTPVPPHQSGDGGRGLNPGARAESANGAHTDRATNMRY